MGAGGIAVAFVVLLVLALLALMTIVAVVLLVTSGTQRRRGREPSPWLQRIAVGLLAVVIGVPGVTFTYAALTNDPDVLELDLRSSIAEDELPGDEFPGFRGFYDIDSERVDLRLPEGRRLTTDVTKTVVTVTDERVASVSIHRRAMEPDAAVRVARSWAHELEMDTPKLDAAADDPASEWSTETSFGSVDARLYLQPVASGELMIPRLRFEPTAE